MKKIFKYLLILLFVIILAAASLHIFMFKTLEKLYVKDNTNSSSTTYFLHADAINAVWVNTARLELGLQYDNSFVKPIISFRDYLFKKGQDKLPENSADDVIWWIIMNSKMYGFYRDDHDGNNLYINNLSKIKLSKLREEIKDNIITLTTKKILFLKEKNLDHYLNILLNGYNRILSARSYIFKEYNNKSVLTEMENIYLHSRIVFKKSYLDNKKINALFFKFYLLSKIIYSQNLENKMKCDSLFIKEYLIYYLELGKTLMFSNQSSEKVTYLLNNSFASNKNKIDTYLLTEIENECTQYTKEVKKFKKMIKQIGAKKIRGQYTN